MWIRSASRVTTWRESTKFVRDRITKANLAAVLDLFCGSGAFLFEAFSRGTFVDGELRAEGLHRVRGQVDQQEGDPALFGRDEQGSNEAVGVDDPRAR